MSHILDEILEQPAALERTLRGALPGIERLRRGLEARRPRLILLAARGTSDNAAQFGRYLLEIATGIPVSLAAPSIFTLYRARVDLKDVLVVAVSQSGESTDTIQVLKSAKRQGALTVGITNEASSTLAKTADSVLLVRAGKERSVAATKTYTGQLLLFYLLAHALGADLSLDDLRRLPEWTTQALEVAPEIERLVERYRFMDRTLVVGRGLNYSNALEFGLKLMETCSVLAERLSSADLLHGPIAMVGESLPVFVFAPPGVTWPPMKEALNRLGRLKAETVLITDPSNRGALSRGERTIFLPLKFEPRSASKQDLFTPIPYIIPAQLFAARLAQLKGLDPDRPRTLTKVTRTM
jgi:glucosamine--fructose-6-phosphate aminotransferase (isomerizing)